MTTVSNNKFPKVLITEGSAPENPDAGNQALWIDSSNHKLKRRNSAGVDTTVEAVVPTTYFVSNTSSRAHTENGTTFIDVENTSITFTAEKAKYHVHVTFTYKFARDGYWEIMINTIAGTNTGTITPSQYTTEYNEGDFNPGPRIKTYHLAFIIEPTIGASVTVKFQFHNSNTGNYITFFNTLVEVF